LLWPLSYIAAIDNNRPHRQFFFQFFLNAYQREAYKNIRV
jgi:hypothetical protein